MKKTLLLLSTTLTLFANQTLWTDIDGDGKQDKIEILKHNDVVSVRCKLTATNRAYKSKPFPFSKNNSTLEKRKNGFLLKGSPYLEELRYQFRYDKKSKQVELIGLDYNHLTKNIQRSTNSKNSINLLTNKFVGEWEYFNSKTKEFMKLPTFKSKFQTNKFYLTSDIEKLFQRLVTVSDKYELQASKRYEKSSKNMAYFLKRKFPHSKVVKNLQDDIANKNITILVLENKGKITVALVNSTSKGYKLMSKNHSILKNSDLDNLNIVKKGRYLSFELNEYGRERVITFRYSKRYKRWYLYKNGVVINGKSRVKTKQDFGVVRFENFKTLGSGSLEV